MGPGRGRRGEPRRPRRTRDGARAPLARACRGRRRVGARRGPAAGPAQRRGRRGPGPQWAVSAPLRKVRRSPEAGAQPCGDGGRTCHPPGTEGRRFPVSAAARGLSCPRLLAPPLLWGRGPEPCFSVLAAQRAVSYNGGWKAGEVCFLSGTTARKCQKSHLRAARLAPPAFLPKRTALLGQGARGRPRPGPADAAGRGLGPGKTWDSIPAAPGTQPLPFGWALRPHPRGLAHPAALREEEYGGYVPREAGFAPHRRLRGLDPAQGPCRHSGVGAPRANSAFGVNLILRNLHPGCPRPFLPPEFQLSCGW